MNRPTSTPPDLSVVIVSWNTAALLQDCLGSLLTPPSTISVEVVVVDNASTDGTPGQVKQNWPQVRLIENADNRGFASANNQGLTVCRGRHIALLNSDTLVTSQALSRLVAFIDEHPEAGACGPRLLQPDGRPQAFAFGHDPTPGYLFRRGFNHLLLRRPLHHWNTDQTQSVDWVSGACLIARRQAIEQVGPLDESIFMYFEDNDWCLRFRQCGWKIYYVPTISITHIGGQSRKQNPAAQATYYTSLRYFYRKHYGRASQLWLTLSLPFYRRFNQP